MRQELPCQTLFIIKTVRRPVPATIFDVPDETPRVCVPSLISQDVYGHLLIQNDGG